MRPARRERVSALSRCSDERAARHRASRPRAVRVCASARVVVKRGSSRRAPSVGGGESRASSRPALSALSLHFHPHTCYRSGFAGSHAVERGGRDDLAPRFRSSAVSPRPARSALIARCSDRRDTFRASALVRALTPASRSAAACCDSEIVILRSVRMCSDG